MRRAQSLVRCPLGVGPESAGRPAVSRRFCHCDRSEAEGSNPRRSFNNLVFGPALLPVSADCFVPRKDKTTPFAGALRFAIRWNAKFLLSLDKLEHLSYNYAILHLNNLSPSQPELFVSNFFYETNTNTLTPTCRVPL